jgi:hypothetical protein
MDGERDTSNTAAKPPSEPALPVESFAKLLTLGGATLYGILFYAYGRYFDELDARPEDVGITYIFILTRSIGLAVFVLIILAAWISVMRLSFIGWAKLQDPEKPAFRFLRYSVSVAALVLMVLGAWLLFHFRTRISAVALGFFVTLLAFPMWEILDYIRRRSKRKSVSKEKPAFRLLRYSVSVAALVLTALGGWLLFHFRTVISAVALVIFMFLLAFPMWKVMDCINRRSERESDSSRNEPSASESGNGTADSEKSLLWSSRKASHIAEPWIIVLGLVAVIMPVALILGSKANDMAHQARDGAQVKPWRVLTFTMLDIQSTPARVAWVGPKDEEPGILSQAERSQDKVYQIRYLGTSGTETLLLIVGNGQARSIRIPAADIEIDTCRSDSNHSTYDECHSEYGP